MEKEKEKNKETKKSDYNIDDIIEKLLR